MPHSTTPTFEPPINTGQFVVREWRVFPNNNAGASVSPEEIGRATLQAVFDLEVAAGVLPAVGWVIVPCTLHQNESGDRWIELAGKEFIWPGGATWMPIIELEGRVRERFQLLALTAVDAFLAAASTPVP